jgi:hypothetical protein
VTTFAQGPVTLHELEVSGDASATRVLEPLGGTSRRGQQDPIDPPHHDMPADAFAANSGKTAALKNSCIKTTALETSPCPLQKHATAHAIRFSRLVMTRCEARRSQPTEATGRAGRCDDGCDRDDLNEVKTSENCRWTPAK